MAEKKILALLGSPHENGHSARLMEAFLKPFYESSWEVKTINAYRENIIPCDDCGYCSRYAGCSKRDLDDFDLAFRDCDLFLLASPVYNDSFPAPLKAIIDRTQRYYEARFSLGLSPPIHKHREAVLLLTMGRDDDYPVKSMERTLKRTFSVMNTELVGSVSWRGLDSGNENTEAVFLRARALALEILKSV